MLAETRGGDANRDGHLNGTAGGLATSVRSDLKQKGHANGKRGRSGTGFTFT